ncbi:hypothetical protein E2562_007433 [Oryza meyeriana var. granulata]|uniref:Uncharacterized protein n=1 Tax=Oryza meyeriana var. granulata TaxID=110450 RepID=A0A6G1CZW2_9ORYZ|nr:hypothetical protein E2562_007433 [Oryza meyeriana var. granulata]
MDMEWLVRLLLGLKMSSERLAVEVAWKRLLKVWFGDGMIMGPHPSFGSANHFRERNICLLQNRYD